MKFTRCSNVTKDLNCGWESILQSVVCRWEYCLVRDSNFSQRI